MNIPKFIMALAMTICALAAGAQAPGADASDPSVMQVTPKPGSASSPTKTPKRASSRAPTVALPAGDVTNEQVAPRSGAASSPTKASRKPHRKNSVQSPLTDPDDPANTNVQPHAAPASRPKR